MVTYAISIRLAKVLDREIIHKVIPYKWILGFNLDFFPQKILVAVEFLLFYRMLCLIFKQYDWLRIECISLLLIDLKHLLHSFNKPPSLKFFLVFFVKVSCFIHTSFFPPWYQVIFLCHLLSPNFLSELICQVTLSICWVAI